MTPAMCPLFFRASGASSEGRGARNVSLKASRGGPPEAFTDLLLAHSGQPHYAERFAGRS